MNDAATQITNTREARLLELADAARREQIVADALDALVNVVASASVPVCQYAPIWAAVEARLRHDAHLAHRRAMRATERVDDVQTAIDARNRWLPTR